MEENKIWYFLRVEDEKKFGPCTEEELIHLLQRELIKPQDYIWMADLDNWMKVSDSIYSEYLPH